MSEAARNIHLRRITSNRDCGFTCLATQGPEWDALTAAQQEERRSIICKLELMREKLKIK